MIHHPLEDLSDSEVPIWTARFQKGQSILRERSNAGPSCVRAWLGCVLTFTLAPAQAVSRGPVLLARLGASEVLIGLQGVSNIPPKFGLERDDMINNKMSRYIP
jgi:hypothetical protein